MKHTTVIILRTLFVVMVLAACVALGLYFSGYFEPEPSIGLIRPAAGADYLDEELLRGEVTDMGVPFLTADLDQGLSASADQLAAAGARVLVIDMDGPILREDRGTLQALTQNGVSLLFAGRDPGDPFLESCGDHAWYVGSEPALAGELLGEQAAMLFREGVAPDLNEDHLLQYVWLGDDAADNKAELLRYTLDELEHYGVYTDELASLHAEGAALAPVAQESCSALEVRPEIFLCSNTAAATAALTVRDALGWQDIPVGAFGANLKEADALAKAGVQAITYYDLKGVTDILALLAANALELQPVAADTELVPSGHTFLQPYLDYEF